MPQADFHIQRDNPLAADINELINCHLQHMAEQSPPESRHALSADALQAANIDFFSLRINGELGAIAALSLLQTDVFELKSMKVADKFKGQGYAQALLKHLIDEAKNRACRKLYLECGSMEYFIAARALYQKLGFRECPAFGRYRLDPNSVYMIKTLD